MKKELQVLGLNPNEAMVYEALVLHGPCKAGALIAALRINRNLVYRALETLVHDGFVTRVERNGVWHFQITDPHSLLTNMRRKEEMFTQVLEVIRLHQSQAQRQIVVYEGKESYTDYWLRSLERSPEGTIDYVAGGGLADWYAVMGRKMTEYWRIARERKIRWKQLYLGLPEGELELLQDVPIPVDCRTWKKPPTSFVGNFNVIHDTVILHTLQDQPRIVEIRDAALVSVFQNYFEMIWKEAKPVRITR